MKYWPKGYLEEEVQFTTLEEDEHGRNPTKENAYRVRMARQKFKILWETRNAAQL